LKYTKFMKKYLDLTLFQQWSLIKLHSNAKEFHDGRTHTGQYFHFKNLTDSELMFDCCDQAIHDTFNSELGKKELTELKELGLLRTVPDPERAKTLAESSETYGISIDGSLMVKTVIRKYKSFLISDPPKYPKHAKLNKLTQNYYDELRKVIGTNVHDPVKFSLIIINYGLQSIGLFIDLLKVFQ